MNFKRFRRAVVAVVLAVAATPALAQGRLNVVTTTEDLASIAREVGGDRIDGGGDREWLPGSSLRRGEAELHPQAPASRPARRGRSRSRDRLAAAAHQQSRNAKIQAGGEWISRCLAAARILDIPQGQITRAMGDVHPLGNPHYWLDPENGKRRSPRRFSTSSHSFAPATARSSSSARRLQRTARRGREAVARRWRRIKGTKVVTYHRSFPNFADRFGLDVIGYVEPRPGIPPSPQHTLDLINEMKRQNVKLVLVEPHFDLRTPNSVGGRLAQRCW